AVAVGELAEIVVGAPVPTVSRIDLAHFLFDEGMPRLAEHRGTAVAGDDIERVPGEARIVHDARPGLAPEKDLRQQPDQVVPLDELPGLIEEEAAIVVAVPRE